MSDVAAIIACTDLIARVYPTLASVARQTAPATGPGIDIVLVTDPSTPPSALQWIDDLARQRGLGRAHAARVTPGAVWNAGIESVSTPYLMCIDAGDLIDPHYYELGCAVLARGGIDVATSWVQMLGPGFQVTHTPQGCTLDDVLDDPDSIHSASMFTRSAWLAAGGFDESLSALTEYDLWLRILSRPGNAMVLDRPLLVRTLRQGAAYRRRWARESQTGPWQHIAERHADTFGRNPARALWAREMKLAELGHRYLNALRERDRAVTDLGALQARARELREVLPPRLRDIADFGDLRRVTPVSRNWGCERGTPVDRYYIERFLRHHAADIRGTVLEVQKDDYARLGGNRVTSLDIVDLDPSNPRATVISDLRCAANIPSESYDAIILTQTLHVIDDIRAVVAECARVLTPGGVLLATLPAASRVCLEYGWDGDYWRFTEAGARALFSETFPAHCVDVRAYGNTLTNAAFLYGLAAEELTEPEFDAFDPYFPLLVTVRAAKPLTQTRNGRTAATKDARAAVLLYHRVDRPRSDVHGLSIPPDEFRRQMMYLRANCTPMPLDALAAAVRKGMVPDRAVAVTFDDGYVDNLTQASPVLLELDIPATFFLTTDRLGDDRFEYWWDLLERLLLVSPPEAMPTELRLRLPQGERAFSMRSPEDRFASHWALYQSIRDCSAVARDVVMETVIRWNPEGASMRSSNRRLRPAEVLELASRAGHAIGAHSIRHVSLPQQPLEVQRHEIEGSHRVLEALVGSRVSAFAYPYGACSSETAEAVQAAGFSIAVTGEGACVTNACDVYRLPRFDVRVGADAFGPWLERDVFGARSAAPKPPR